MAQIKFTEKSNRSGAVINTDKKIAALFVERGEAEYTETQTEPQTEPQKKKKRK